MSVFLENAPSHWRRSTFRRFARVLNGADYGPVEVDSGGYPVYGSGGEFRRASAYLFDGESVLFGRKGTVDKPIYVNGKFWTVDTMFYTDIDESQMSPRFAYYWATTLPYWAWATDTALPSMTSGAIKAAPIALPPLAEQRAIADFLDRETAKIDAFIAKNEQLIALLTERRAAAVERLVIQHAGEVEGTAGRAGDEDWVEGPLKRFVTSLDHRRIPLSAEERGVRRGEFNYYGASGVIDHVDSYIFDEPLVLVSEDGANLVMRNHPVAFVATGTYWVNNHAHVLRPKDGVTEFWAARIEAMDLNPYVTGSAQPKLTAHALLNLPVTAPPVGERERIAAKIEGIRTVSARAIQTARDAIELARERRAALISAAVTGKIDVGVDA